MLNGIGCRLLLESCLYHAYTFQKRRAATAAKNGCWLNELDSLGIEPKRKTELDDAEELENLADIIKQAMFQDYKIAYSEKGDTYREEANLTVTFG